ncbi:hypothetical protein Agub_g14657, partial [Astrephomene gubernaculifera]
TEEARSGAAAAAAGEAGEAGPAGVTAGTTAGTTAEGAGADGGAVPEGGGAPASGRKRRPKGSITKVLTSASAARLRQRMDLLSQLRRGLKELAQPPPPPHSDTAGERRSARVLSSHTHNPNCGVAWELSPALTGKRGVLPPWWLPEHDVQLAHGVVRHGFGAWDAIARDPQYSFESCARATGAVPDVEE